MLVADGDRDIDDGEVGAQGIGGLAGRTRSAAACLRRARRRRLLGGTEWRERCRGRFGSGLTGSGGSGGILIEGSAGAFTGSYLPKVRQGRTTEPWVRGHWEHSAVFARGLAPGRTQRQCGNTDGPHRTETPHPFTTPATARLHDDLSGSVLRSLHRVKMQRRGGGRSGVCSRVPEARSPGRSNAPSTASV